VFLTVFFLNKIWQKSQNVSIRDVSITAFVLDYDFVARITIYVLKNQIKNLMFKFQSKFQFNYLDILFRYNLAVICARLRGLKYKLDFSFCIVLSVTISLILLNISCINIIKKFLQKLEKIRCHVIRVGQAS